MRIDPESYVEAIGALNAAGGGQFGVMTRESREWFLRNGINADIMDLFSHYMPKTEVWAGAGNLFDEGRIIRWNEEFPEGLCNKLFIVGSAANGDHIAIDLTTGSVGYIAHELHWQVNPKAYFIVVSPSIGRFLMDVNFASKSLPADYWEARDSTLKEDMG